MEQKLQIIPLGGLGEIGKNITAFCYANTIVVIDCGLSFPEDELLGIDVVIPDITYLLENQKMVRGIILTHGHEDHIGAIPYILKDLNVPIYATRLTLGLLEEKIKENYSGTEKPRLQCIKPREHLQIGPFDFEFFRTSHSIADAIGVAIHTPVGTIVHTGDFKIDLTPVDEKPTDIYTLARLGEEGVLLLMSDSTNIEKPGFTASEKTVGDTLEQIFSDAPGRIIIASFASNVSRLQQIISIAQKNKRKVVIAGRSMINVAKVASDLDYLNIPKDMVVELTELSNLPSGEVVIITTGSQGEPMSALARIAMSDHKRIEIQPGDTVIISANPIPGNEKLVAKTVDNLFRLGANVIHESISGVHASGHASREELKLMLNLVKPEFFVPIHGEYRMLVKHARLAQEMGVNTKNIFILDNGQILEFNGSRPRIGGKVQAGRVFVDGLGIGDVGSVVLRDRKQLSQDGILIVVVSLSSETGEVLAGPDIISRGFVYVKESEELMEEIRNKVSAILQKYKENEIDNWLEVKAGVKEMLGKYLYEKTKRKPMILPIIMEI